MSGSFWEAVGGVLFIGVHTLLCGGALLWLAHDTDARLAAQLFLGIGGTLTAGIVALGVAGRAR